MKEKKVEVFLSYCWSDKELAEKVYNSLNCCKQINLHMDVLKIHEWKSIKEYMQSIVNMDYAILLISETYLKSSNCMYEVLELMKDIKYKDKIFPAVVHTAIYSVSERIKFVVYWQNELKNLIEEMKEIEMQNLGTFVDELKHRQNIVSNIAEFLQIVSDMNNPKIEDISVAIKNKLHEIRIIEANDTKDIYIENNNIYIYIKYANNEGFNIDFERSTEVDFYDWHSKVKSGGEIIIDNEYINIIENYLNDSKKSISEEDRKVFYDGIKNIVKCDEIIKIMIRKALIEDVISNKIKRFSCFVKATADICFPQSYAYNNVREDKPHVLEVYYGTESFKFDISDDDYTNVLEKSGGEIEIPHCVFFNEFASWVTDKYILENEIIPIYLKINAIRELDSGNEIPVKDFSHWFISRG